MKKNKKERLIGLGADALADALCELSNSNDAVADTVERMIAAPGENVRRFRANLDAIKRFRDFIGLDESAGFARKLRTLLRDLEAGVDDPRMGCALVADFYEADNRIFESCDDSDGDVGDVYHFDAKELFVGFGRDCTDKEWLTDLVFRLNLDDDYGVRDALIDCAAEYLPEPNIRTLIGKLQEAANKESRDYQKRGLLGLVESLARQIGDAPLFEKTRIESREGLSSDAFLDIARVYLDRGDAETALSWIEKVPPEATFQANDLDRLLLDIHGKLGEPRKQADVAWRIFRRYRCMTSLQELLSVIGAEQRESVIAGEVQAILGDKTLSLTDAEFLLELGLMEELEHYILERLDQLEGDLYGSLLPLAEAMEAAKRHLSATMIFRALLDSILRRAKAKTYPHGVRYLKKLERLAKSVTDWSGLDDHRTYLQQLRRAHGRKSSFWSQYDR